MDSANVVMVRVNSPESLFKTALCGGLMHGWQGGKDVMACKVTPACGAVCVCVCVCVCEPAACRPPTMPCVVECRMPPTWGGTSCCGRCWRAC